MRFRRLTDEELEALEQDFIQFLASQQISAKDWLNMKANSIDKVHALIDVFSDIVLEKVFNKIEYLQHRSKDSIRVFYCQQDKITMTGMMIADHNIDLRNNDDLKTMSDPKAIKGKIKIFQMEKQYKAQKADELFSMIYKDGCQQAEPKLFQMLVDMYHQTTN